MSRDGNGPDPALPTVILAYHRISGRPLLAGTWNTPRQLAAHLDALLRERAAFADPGRWDGHDEGGVLVTFDDGTEDLFHHRQVLAARGIRPLIFVPAGLLGRRNSWEWPLPGRRTRHLTRHQVRRLVELGWEIGVHGASHQDLTGLSEPHLEAEIRGAREILEEATGRPTRFFAYPYGRCTPLVARCVQAAGFQGAFTMTAGCPGIPRPYCRPRRPVYCIDAAADILAKVRDPVGRTVRGRWQLVKERGAHGVGRWAGGIASRIPGTKTHSQQGQSPPAESRQDQGGPDRQRRPGGGGHGQVDDQDQA